MIFYFVLFCFEPFRNYALTLCDLFQSFLAADCFLITVYQLLPLLCFAFLLHFRGDLSPPAATPELALLIRDDKDTCVTL